MLANPSDFRVIRCYKLAEYGMTSPVNGPAWRFGLHSAVSSAQFSAMWDHVAATSSRFVTRWPFGGQDRSPCHLAAVPFTVKHLKLLFRNQSIL